MLARLRLGVQGERHADVDLPAGRVHEELREPPGIFGRLAELDNGRRSVAVRRFARTRGLYPDDR